MALGCRLCANLLPALRHLNHQLQHLLNNFKRPSNLAGLRVKILVTSGTQHVKVSDTAFNSVSLNSFVHFFLFISLFVAQRQSVYRFHRF